MYTLTQIAKDGFTSHDYLGYGFGVVNKEISPEYFLKSYLAWSGENDNPNAEIDINENIFAFVISEGGKEIFPLYKNQQYYIVTENGKTFKNLTLK